jgi:Holliday junction resolvase
VRCLTRTIRQQRGYSFEYKIVTEVNKMDGWVARRLGGSSTGLPDIVATNNQKSRLIVAELKSLTPRALKTSKNLASSVLYIPQDEAARCVNVARMFGVYKYPEVVFAFKFSNVSTRMPIYYYFALLPHQYGHLLYPETVIKCTSAGTCTIIFKDQFFTLPSRPYFV